MKPLPMILLTVSSLAFAQNYKAEATGAPPSEVAPAVASLMAPKGYKISGPSGAFCEVWFRTSMPSAAKASGDSIAFPTIPYGSLVGVIRFPSQGADRRGQPIKPGVYTMRYGNYPVNGDHLGVAPQRDFLVLVPAADDKDPNATPAHEPLMEMGKKASGTPHPAVLSMEPPPSGGSVGSLTKEGEHDWALTVKAGDTTFGLILIGKAEA